VAAAQALLVVVGSVTAVVAALVMTTRISIKVSLAWSTCAQMGFMLMQCGLGLHELALLHLVAHSLYKAHAFLGAGGAVEQHRLRRMTPAAPAPSAAGWALGALVGLVLVAGAAIAWGLQPAQTPALWAAGGILALALAPLLAGSPGRTGRTGGPGLPAVAVAAAVALAYFGLHAAFGHWLGGTAVGPAPAPAWIAWVLLCFAALFVVQGVVRVKPQGALARRLYPWLFAGLYLDELFTRLTFRLWPARLPARPDARHLPGSRSPTPGVQS
jgi:NAD(P)H-quinone oxidoreductase subunit 5